MSTHTTLAKPLPLPLIILAPLVKTLSTIKNLFVQFALELVNSPRNSGRKTINQKFRRFQKSGSENAGVKKENPGMNLSQNQKKKKRLL